jgi:hypothetical protein
VAEGGEQVTLALRAESRLPRPVQALLAFPGQHVGLQFGARPVPQPGGTAENQYVYESQVQHLPRVPAAGFTVGEEQPGPGLSGIAQVACSCRSKSQECLRDPSADLQAGSLGFG